MVCVDVDVDLSKVDPLFQQCNRRPLRTQYKKSNATTRQLIKILIKFFNRRQCEMNAKNVPFKPDFLSDDIAKLLRIGRLHFAEIQFCCKQFK